MSKLVVIGAGIAGLATLRKIVESRHVKYQEVELISLPQDDFNCSLNSTATVALRGISPGVSPLGDKLYQAYSIFHDQITKLAGVEAAVHQICLSPNYSRLENLLGRYSDWEKCSDFHGNPLTQNSYRTQEPAYVIEPKVLLEKLLADILSACHRQKIRFIQTHDKVFQLVPGLVQGLKSQYIADDILCALSYWRKIFLTDQSFFPLNTRPSQGSFLQWDADYGPISWSARLNDVNLIYRGTSRSLLMGSTNAEVHHFIANEKELSEFYDQVRNLFNNNWLPDYEKANIITGIRQKNGKRLPFWDIVLNEDDKRIAVIEGLHKNGWSLAFLAAKEMSMKLLGNT